MKLLELFSCYPHSIKFDNFPVLTIVQRIILNHISWINFRKNTQKNSSLVLIDSAGGLVKITHMTGDSNCQKERLTERPVSLSSRFLSTMSSMKLKVTKTLKRNSQKVKLCNVLNYVAKGIIIQKAATHAINLNRVTTLNVMVCTLCLHLQSDNTFKY